MPPSVLRRTTRGTGRALSAAVHLVAAVAVVLSVTVPLPASAQGPTDRLLTGQALAAGDGLHAVGSAHVLAVGADGDVTLSLGGRVLWHTGTTGNPGARLVQQAGGALEVRSRADAVLWTTATASPGARSVLKPDGVLYTISTAGTVAWKSAGVPGPTLRTTVADRVPSGGLLLPRESVTSPDGTVRLTMGTDGALVLTAADRTVWRSPATRAGASAVVAPEGDLRVVGTDGAVLWSTGTTSPGARLVVKDHGRAYLISATHASVWSTPDTPAERVPTVVSLPLPEPLPVVSGGLGGTRPGTTTSSGAALDERPQTTVLAARPQYVDPTSPAARAAQDARADGRDTDAALLAKAAAQGSARWLGPQDATATVASSVRAYAATAAAAGQTPVLVTYAIPDRDCGGLSAGGFATAGEYRAWIDQVAAGLARAKAVVVVEPDALLHLERCGDRDARLAMLRYAVGALTRAGAEVYLDAASSNSFGWGTVALRDMALRLRAAGVDQAAGFAVNTSNFQRSEHEVAYGRHLSALLSGASFVVDTSRNGTGALAGPDGTVWCNPAGRALGSPPRATLDGPHVADLWVKTVGLSDGTCAGGPAAGRLWEEYLLGLASRAAW
ncbi:glycoside hydrolase family 6 protein [Cellulomonas algicola]|uniref:glycoside hydrolase family 6 protein n=1 Tax=Cellulomonas algicola TaxID=2071633 RepID=UPI001C3FDA88|nr:glycoside hydrolase family 6 protein [Cellulomonas algicola]